MSDLEATPSTQDKPVNGEVEHPFLEAFGADNVVEHPGELEHENEDPAGDADAPAP